MSTRRKISSFIIPDPDLFLKKLLNWLDQHDRFCFLNSNHHFHAYGTYEWLIGVGGETVSVDQGVQTVNDWHQENKDWLFGTLSYDFKNELEHLSSNNPESVGFPNLSFFNPAHVLRFDHKLLYIESKTEAPADVFESIQNSSEEIIQEFPPIELQPSISKDTYIKNVKILQDHIQWGDIYEVNFCQEFYAAAELHPVASYWALNNRTKAPFSTFYKNGASYILSGSPERYLAKRGDKVISQPIKGTARRSKDYHEDGVIKEALISSVKERAENVMIVDLVRNDLSRTAKENSVQVEELFGLYTFPTVHQLISTVSSTLIEPTNWAEVIEHSFPMGSMTGAPKVSAMKLIETFENFKRGMYSGSVGYISPQGDFDFNVIIRSIIYDAAVKRISAPVGGAITILSDPEAEYEECLIKIAAIKNALK